MLYKHLNHDAEVLESFLAESKQSAVELLIEEFEKWEKRRPSYAARLIYLIQDSQHQIVRDFLKKRVTEAELLAYVPPAPPQAVDE